MLITSLQNPKIRHAVKLKERHHRDKERRTVLEGFRAISRAIDSNITIEECFYCPSMLPETDNQILSKIAEHNGMLIEVSPAVLKKMTYRDRPEGLIAIASVFELRLDAIPIKEDGLYLLVESIEKPGNLGAILRSADATKTTGLIVCDKCTDIYNPNVITASTGTVFSVPIAECSSERAIQWLRKYEIRSIAATPHSKTVYTDVDMSGKVAIIVGSEQEGLSKFWLKNTDTQAKIPMLGIADSLNVAAATTILLYEAARQRTWKQS